MGTGGSGQGSPVFRRQSERIRQSPDRRGLGGRLIPPAEVLRTALEELGQRPFMSDELRNAIADLGRIVSKIPLVPVAAVGQAASLLRPKEGDIVKAKARVAKALAGESPRLLIVLDDIDRLSADEIRELFRLVKSVGDLPNVIYPLSFDRCTVTTALDQFQENRGAAYLEKIVQLPLNFRYRTRRSPTPAHV
jgi:hypothetical protein